MCTQSRAFMSENGLPQLIKLSVAFDAVAIVEHTKRVLYLDDDDIAHIAEGKLHIYHFCRGEDGNQTSDTRSLKTLKIGTAEITKVELSHFTHKVSSCALLTRCHPACSPRRHPARAPCRHPVHQSRFATQLARGA